MTATQSRAHRPLGMRAMVGSRLRYRTLPVAAQIRDDDREFLGEPRRHPVPHRVRLGKAVKEERRRSVTGDPAEDIRAVARYGPRREPGKEIAAHLIARQPMSLLQKPSGKSIAATPL
jgi:hypothetical protein